MRRNTINVSWQGEAHDCDFNQMLKLPLAGHCFGCTTDASSSCGGAIVEAR